MKGCTAFLGLGVLGLFLGGCSSSTTAPTSQADQSTMKSDSWAAVTDFKQRDPGMDQFLQHAYGYAIFPSVGKGAVGVGGAYGRAEVYEQGKLIGYATMTQATVGAQIGGQTYAELIVFDTKAAMDNFKAGATTFSAQVSAVAIQAGAADAARYRDGVAVFVDPKGGLMGEASIGGQQFNYEPTQAVSQS